MDVVLFITVNRSKTFLVMYLKVIVYALKKSSVSNGSTLMIQIKFVE